MQQTNRLKKTKYKLQYAETKNVETKKNLKIQ